MEAHSQDPTIIDHKLRYQEGILAIEFEDGTNIPFRILTYGEVRAYKSLVQTGTLSQEQIEEQIYTTCVLDEYYKDKPESLRAGIPSTLSRLILQVSAPEDHNELVNSFTIYREKLEDVEEQMKMVICATFPGYTIGMLDSCTFDTLTRLFAGAEWLMVWRGGEQFDFSKKGSSSSGRISDKEIAQSVAATRG